MLPVFSVDFDEYFTVFFISCHFVRPELFNVWLNLCTARGLFLLCKMAAC